VPLTRLLVKRAESVFGGVTYHVLRLFGNEGDAAGPAIFNLIFDETHGELSIDCVNTKGTGLLTELGKMYVFKAVCNHKPGISDDEGHKRIEPT
jgi:hypothetical protein